jgi:hypothetical protein
MTAAATAGLISSGSSTRYCCDIAVLADKYTLSDKANELIFPSCFCVL